MSDIVTSLCRYMPRWMAQRGAALLGSLPPEVERWVQDTAQWVDQQPGPPDSNAWQDEIVQRFCEGRAISEPEALVGALRSAVLLVAIQRMPPPDIVPDGATAARVDTKTKKLDPVGLKRSRVLGLLEKGLPASEQVAGAVLGPLVG